MTREKLLNLICDVNPCVDFNLFFNEWLDEYDKHVIEQYKDIHDSKANTNLKDTIKDIHDNVAQEMYCKGVDDLCNEISTYRMYDEYDNVIDLLEIAEKLKEHNKWHIQSLLKRLKII